MTQSPRDKIAELRAMHDDGLLSLDEFNTRKNAILDAEYAPPVRAHAPALQKRGTEIGLMAGMEIGPHNRRYKLERLIAEGAMGQVWQALDLATHAELGHSEFVALKVLSPQLTKSPSHAKLLIEEATQARRLAHEHIVRVYEWAQDPATSSYFIIMECLEGEDLDQLIAREKKFPLERITQLLAPVAQALHYAWEKHKLVHRDLKPANVFLSRRGEVKLLDFGIAARSRAGSAKASLQAPAQAGTQGYRAPEGGAEPSRALDVYAIAVMIYQMLEGRLPFEGRRSEQFEPTKPSAINPRQWGVLQSGFAWRADERPASVADLLDALQRAAGPSAQELAAQHAAARAKEEERQRQLALQRKQEADAALQAQRLRDKQRREQDLAGRAAAEEAAKARKDILRRQLAERRAADLEKARQEQDAQARKLAQAKAAAAYRAEQQRARAEAAARSAAELAALLPNLDSPTADAEGVLRDRFIDGAGRGPELVLIPTGRFHMGSHHLERELAVKAGSQQAWVEREIPQRWVGIESSFALGRYPVTVGQWRVFVRATAWEPSGEADWTKPGFVQTDEHPVTGVSWLDAQHYIRWLSEQTGQTYRLPSEAEWEYACRAGTKTAFSFGDSISTDQANYDGNYSYNGSPKGAFREGTTKVGSFAPNPWGLYDMHGNVWEWVQDPVHENYQGAPLDGRVWEEGGDPERRVLRGGSWLYSPRYLRSALRNGFAAALSNDVVGFRVARKLV